ncbi:MAG: hypothetical protein H7123_04505, partial [Thermoleophilia bacterium]|nr:hypothetical protein [Thermoleophilia bacterium]
MSLTRTDSIGERGVTIVECLVGLMIVTIVMVGAISMFGDSGHVQERAQVRAKMAATADDITQKVRAGDSWTKQAQWASCRTQSTTGCDMSALFPPPKDTGPNTPAFIQPGSVRITAVDSAGDGIGAADLDRINTDFYRIDVKLQMTPASASKFGAQQAFVV